MACSGGGSIEMYVQELFTSGAPKLKLKQQQRSPGSLSFLRCTAQLYVRMARKLLKGWAGKIRA
jgi:hypothetical protein